MYAFSAISGGLCVAAWLYLLLAHGEFWKVGEYRPEVARDNGAGERIAAVIPARNEADVIGRAVSSLREQHWQDLRIFVVDDNSTDETAQSAREVGTAGAGTVTVVAGGPLPRGWSGKLWAVQQGVEQALATGPDFLLLTDADIEHAPGSLARLVAIAQAGSYDLTSFMVKLHCRSVAERLLIPAFVFFFFMLYPPNWVRDRNRKTAGAAGGCMLIRPAALERIGGITAIRQEIIDDCALARAVKKSGGKVWLGAAGETHSLRPYGSFVEMERMISRAAFNQLQHSTWLLLGTVLSMLLIFVWPVVLLAGGSGALVGMGAVACALMCFAYLPMIRFYGLNPLWALSLPVSAVFYTAATIDSAIRYWSGRGGEWKGRAQDPN